MKITVGSRLGSYEVRALLGEGGMGRVFRAFDTKLQREVAIKVLPESIAADHERLARFEREARTLAALNHPHIAQIYSVEDGAIVMELVDGETLAERIRQGPLPLDEALPIARQIIDALQAAHETGIIHRDLKPANIKVRADGTVKVLDFGLAKADVSRQSGGMDAANSPTFTSPAMTAHGVILGTAAYMSPEQARGKSVDQRTDIWAFGCVLYEMLSSRTLFEGETVSDTIAAILSRDATLEHLPLSVPANIRRLLAKCLARDPRARLHHVADARFDLDDARSNADAIHTTPRRRLGGYVATGVLATAITAIAMVSSMPMWVGTPTSPLPIQLALPMPGPYSASNGVMFSPDGRHLIARGSGGASTLYSLDGAPSRPLDERPHCWSPDSRSIVLQRLSGELLRMDLSGGPPVGFATTAALSGCSWNRAGIVLTASIQGLGQVPATGGPVTPVEIEDGVGPNRVRLLPAFLPDGRRFLYWSLTPDGKRNIRAGSLDSRETTLVVASDGGPAYTEGYLLYQRGAALVAQAFDEATLSVKGEPQALTTESASGSLQGRAFFDASETGMLAFATTNGGVSGHSVWINRDGSTITAVPSPEGAELVNPALSADGTQLAGNRRDPSTGNWDIWTMDVRSGVSTRLTTDNEADVDPVWSPDGSEIAYVSNRQAAPGLYRIHVADRREQLIVKFEAAFGSMAAIRPTDWTPDGRYILCDFFGDIVAVSTTSPNDEPKPVVVSPATEGGGKVSRDGRWIAYHSRDANQDSIYVQPFPGPGVRTRVSMTYGRHPQWRDDGAELFWTGSVTNNWGTSEALHSAKLAISGGTVKASAPAPVFPSHVTLTGLIDNRRHYAVANGGQRFLLRQPEGAPGPVVKIILNWKSLLSAR